jgi:hypothetical protein
VTIRKGLADNLREDRSNLIVTCSLLGKPIGLTIVLNGTKIRKL